MKRKIQEVLGYVIGGLIVLVLVPLAIYAISQTLDGFFHLPVFNSPTGRIILSSILVVIGFLFGFWSIVAQNVIGKGGPLQIADIEISPKTQNLVVSGPYKYTRNPMLFGASLVYLAFALYLNSIFAILIVILLIVFMLMVVVKMEEERLLKDFGTAYEEYRQRTSMFFPWLSRGKE